MAEDDVEQTRRGGAEQERSIVSQRGVVARNREQQPDPSLDGGAPSRRRRTGSMTPPGDAWSPARPGTLVTCSINRGTDGRTRFVAADAARFLLALIGRSSEVSSSPPLAVSPGGATFSPERFLVARLSGTESSDRTGHPAARPIAGRAESSSTADAARAPAIELALEGEIWTLRGLGAVVRLRDSRGLRMLAQLIARPGRELHVLDLACAPVGVIDAGDAGPRLDRTAIDAYSARLRELQQEVVEAESWNDAGRLARAQEEVELLEAEVKSAFGLGGRQRRVGGAAERARINVQRRIAAVVRKVRAASPALGRHLAGAVHTGTFCSYQP